jgi:hypothetical protein
MSSAPDSRFQRRKAIATFLRKLNVLEIFGLEAKRRYRSSKLVCRIRNGRGPLSRGRRLQSGSITLKQSCRLAVQTGLAIILGFLLSNESAYEPGLRAGVSQLEIPESDLGLGPTWSALPHSTAMFGRIRGIGPGTNQNRNANWFCNIPAASARKGPFHGHFFANAIPLGLRGGTFFYFAPKLLAPKPAVLCEEHHIVLAAAPLACGHSQDHRSCVPKSRR